MSASRMPTLRPSACRPSARLQAVVDLPTPPLPDATAITCLTPGTDCALGEGAALGRPGVGLGAVRGGGRSAVRLTKTPLTPGKPWTAVSAACRTRSMAAASAGSTAIENMTQPALSTTTSDKRPEAARLAPPASIGTAASACRTCSRVIATDRLLGAACLDVEARARAVKAQPAI